MPDMSTASMPHHPQFNPAGVVQCLSCNRPQSECICGQDQEAPAMAQWMERVEDALARVLGTLEAVHGPNGTISQSLAALAKQQRQIQDRLDAIERMMQ